MGTPVGTWVVVAAVGCEATTAAEADAPLAAEAAGGTCDEAGGTALRLDEFGAAFLRDGSTLR